MSGLELRRAHSHVNMYLTRIQFRSVQCRCSCRMRDGDDKTTWTVLTSFESYGVVHGNNLNDR
jgi:hypothetical protein